MKNKIPYIKRIVILFVGIVVTTQLMSMDVRAQRIEDYTVGTLQLPNGSERYIADHSKWIPNDSPYQHTLQDGRVYDGITFLVNEQRELYLIYLCNKERELELYAYAPELKTIFPVERYAERYLVSAYACNEWPSELSGEIISSEGVMYIFDSKDGFFGTIGADGTIRTWNPDDSKLVKENKSQMWTIAIIAIGVPGVVLILLVLFIGIRKLAQRGKDNDSGNRIKNSENVLEELTEFRKPIIYDKDVEREYAGEKPVISVQHITMTYKLLIRNANSLIDYIELFFKHKKTYREFNALDDVSFNVYKGEVVGIIGSNGAGKSTLLKIISGALTPTKGQVIVDKSKIQLLTIGTGFDVELTGRENVYLNGALIGYSKKYLDEHFDEIVEFAELQDFIDEKVKNYSSGMVSRLGFAIATAGDAAEILILDEVLSVGDEFFRKKSLARITEMIHGGSTVLMVSHDMGTIIENCSKVVGIEKGVLQTVGDVKTVCGMHQAKED